ncbi:alpha-mannosidase 2x-like [Dreissena polymorpha]|uniref:alpha-mannosidase 2x-like n=1 Tax=Dreissena polymorpha TaxID=45954 RepID=UPI00226551E2|nr:alpha-mannosidase 2x-like [Dreissena polymorpha]
MRITWLRFHRKWRRLAVLVVAVYLVVNGLLFSKLIGWVDHLSSLMEKRYDPFGSIHRNPCPMQRNLYASERILTGSDAVCQAAWSDNDADIQMESVLDELSVGYPNLVLTVYGWADTIRVEAWSPAPLTVIVMPHSHQDPGWLSTMDAYYTQFTKGTLDNIAEQLSANPSWTFIWNEIVFLQRWWTDASNEQRIKFKKLLVSGQLELVSGGLVMPDESLTHFNAILDQLVEGHQWVKQTFNITIENNWAIDPFGHSATVPYLLREAGLKNMVIQRTHFAVKREFAKKRSFEFYWRQSWDFEGKHDMFCHMLPFLLYNIPHSCGPDRHVCCQFDFHHQHCYHGKSHIPVVSVTENNLAELAESLWEQLQKKASLYRHGVVLLPHGDDFRYATKPEWETQMFNLQKIMDYINRNDRMQTKIKFGTLNDYFKAVKSEKAPGPPSSKGPFAVLSGDFLPYSDRSDQYWTGFYTSRPWIKEAVSRLQDYLRSAEILFTLSLSVTKINTSMASLYRKLESSRRTLAVSLHHDAITGTSKANVMQDNKLSIQQAFGELNNVHETCIKGILKNYDHKYQTINITGDSGQQLLILRQDLPIRLLIWNSIGTKRDVVARVLTDTRDVHVTDVYERRVTQQVDPEWTKDGHVTDGTFWLSFQAEVPGFSVAGYLVDISTDDVYASLVTLYNLTSSKQGTHETINSFYIQPRVTDYFNISNDILTASFSSCDGLLSSVYYPAIGATFTADLSFITYSTGHHTHPFRDKSGAYIFLPDGSARYISEQPTVVLTEGKLFSQVRSVYKSFTLVATIYHTTNADLSNGIHLETEVNLNSDTWDNTELGLRLETNVYDSSLGFCTDANGFQMQHRRTRQKLTIQGNFYPITTLASLNDHSSVVSLHTSHAHAVASLASGWLEVMLDRRLVQHDWRGLGEGVTDNVPTRSTFFLTFEEYSRTNMRGDSVCLQSIHTIRTSIQLNNPPKLLEVISASRPNNQNIIMKDTSIDLSAFANAIALPCDYHVVNMKTMIDSDSLSKFVLITIHRPASKCHQNGNDQTSSCANKVSLKWGEFLPFAKEIWETTLNGIEKRRPLAIEDNIHVDVFNIKTFLITFREIK